LLLILLGSAACGEDPKQDSCGLGLERPDVANGTARYFRDGSLVAATGGGYKLEFPNDIVIGDMTINIKQDIDRRTVADMIDTASFPICVPLDSNSDGSGYALAEGAGASFMTDDTHVGKMVILSLEGDAIVGRFAFVAKENGGERLTRVEDGVFHLLPR
jgi:hypothetical protein